MKKKKRIFNFDSFNLQLNLHRNNNNNNLMPIRKDKGAKQFV